MPKTSPNQAARKPSKAEARAQRRQEEARRQAAAKAAVRRRWWTAGAVVALAVVIIVVAIVLSGGSKSVTEVAPPGVHPGTPDVQPAAHQVANPTSIKGVIAYDTTGWPSGSHNGPAADALSHKHVTGPVTYSVTPPVGGDHNGVWMNCGVYSQPVPNERAVHDLEHGAVWITYRPGLSPSEISQLRQLQGSQSVISGSHYVDLTPYPGLSSPIVISAWGYQLKVSSPTDPRLQRFINTFRDSHRYSPEYGGECTGGVGTPLET